MLLREETRHEASCALVGACSTLVYNKIARRADRNRLQNVGQLYDRRDEDRERRKIRLISTHRIESTILRSDKIDELLVLATRK